MKIVKKSYKYRIYPSDSQKKQLAHSFGCSRWVYNYFLNLRTKLYRENNERIGYNKTSAILTSLKRDKDFSWLKNVSCVVLQQSLRDLDKAFSKLFRNKAHYPKFKKKNSKQSVRYTRGTFSLKDGSLKISKNKENLDVRWSRKLNGIPSSITISKDSANRYFVSFVVEEKIQPFPRSDKIIGIDVGIKDICVTSDGFKSGSPQYFRMYEKSLARRQRELSRKVKGSKNRIKARLKVAKIHAKISDSRNDFNNKLSTKLIRENQTISVESLNVKGMMRNHKLAKSIADSSWHDFFRKIKYKADWYGREILEIDRWFPSSKKCNRCGYINDILKLSDRSWECISCKETLDRDINAAKNILTVGLAGVAFGENVRLKAESSA